VYLGFDDVNNAYKVKEWYSGQKYYTADITFHPKEFPYRTNPSRSPALLRQYDDYAPHLAKQVPVTNPTADLQPRRSARQQDYQYSGDQLVSDIPDEDVPPAENFMVHSFGPDPDTWREALDSKWANEWIIAREKEKNSFKEHGVLEMVPRETAKGKRVYKPKVVLKIKVNPPTPFEPHATLDTHKYRMTIAALKHTMKPGIDYTEKYASTVRWNSVKMIIAIAVKHDFDLVLFDISTFFLYGELDDEVYMEIPEGWEEEDKPRENFVFKLHRSMYGLPQASYCAQRKLKSTLTGEGKIKATTADDCIYVNTAETEYGALGAHVDDLLAAGDTKGLDTIEKTLSKTFKITKKVNPVIVTGVQIQRDRKHHWLKLHQGGNIEAMLAKYNMSECRPVDTPMDPGTAKILMELCTDDADPYWTKKYQILVGELMYLHKTRPDLLFAINLLSRFLKNATARHYELARDRVLRYLRGTTEDGIVFYAKSDRWELSGAADADLAGDLSTSRSTSGGCTVLGDFGAIMTSSKLEKKISTSTGQSETYAMTSLVKEVVWARHMLRELRHAQRGPTVLLTDNAGVFKQATKAINHTIAKHYRIAQAYIRSMVSDGVVEVAEVDTKENTSDMLTKALHAPLFRYHKAALMGPQTAPQ
jgi:hypothetical protein